MAHKQTVSKEDRTLLEFVEDLKRQWMSTIDALIDPLMIVSQAYQIRKANKALARIAGSDVKDLVGKKCFEVFAERQTPCPGCGMLEAATQNKSANFELKGIRGNRFFEVSSQPLFDSEGRVDGIVQVYRDRTEAKRIQEHLSQQEKLASIGLLAGGVAHEINNPLGGILIFSQMLLREMDKSSPHYQDVVEIEAATQRCKAIVESLLNFARQQPVEQEASQVVNAIDAIRTAMRFATVGMQRKLSIDIQEDFDREEHLIVGDRNKLIQVFLNLMQNSIQAMPDGGNLIIRSKTDEDADPPEVIYEVEDSGVGIPPEHLKKIFDPFFTTKDPGEGTGLGLALCYGIVQDIGGKLSVESRVNVGTTFRVRLPLAVPEANPQAS